MTIMLPPEVEIRLQELAAHVGQSPEHYLASLVSEKLAYDAWFKKCVEEGIASLDRGEYLTQEEVEARFAPYLKDECGCVGRLKLRMS